jgi:Xaa-Pro aminopeptidase
MKPETVRNIQKVLAEENLDAWFFSCFKGSDPTGPRVFDLPEGVFLSRRWFCIIPRTGDPVKLCHRIEPHALDAVPGEAVFYSRWQEWQEMLSKRLKGKKRLAVQFSEGGVIPALGRLDAGTADFLRGLGVTLVSSGDLVARFEVTCTQPQEEGHYRAMETLLATVEMAFAQVRHSLTQNEKFTEYDLQQEMALFMRQHGLLVEDPPIVAVGPNAADPHYFPQPQGSALVERDRVLLLDLWAKEDKPGAVFADITWCAWTGAKVPEEESKVWDVVRQARDAGIARAREVSHRTVAGWEVDRAAREVIEKAGHGEFFIHRTGHSMHTDDHANGANMDDFETRDFRRLLPNTLFSIEPGIYLPGRFGFRSEVNMLVTRSAAVVTGRKQETLPALLADEA